MEGKDFIKPVLVSMIEEELDSLPNEFFTIIKDKVKNKSDKELRELEELTSQFYDTLAEVIFDCSISPERITKDNVHELIEGDERIQEEYEKMEQAAMNFPNLFMPVIVEISSDEGKAKTLTHFHLISYAITSRIDIPSGQSEGNFIDPILPDGRPFSHN